MVYIGSKQRIIKEILPLILKNRKPGQTYVEPFAGGFNSIQYVSGKRLACDNHRYLIALIKAVRDGWKPPDFISELWYRQIKEKPDSYPDHFVGFVGFCGFGAQFFSGYPMASRRNYFKERRDNLLNQAPLLKGIDIQCSDYRDLKIPKKSLIYCDPPYSSTLSYGKDKFNTAEFWNWVYLRYKDGHKLFISEYTAPEWATAIWQKSITSSIAMKTKKNKY